MRNTEIIEVQLMYEKIKNIETPKEALEILAKSDLEMGFANDVKITRFQTYAYWLKQKGMDDWFYYLKEVSDFLGALTLGVFKKVGDEPENWINPLPYIEGQINRR